MRTNKERAHKQSGHATFTNRGGAHNNKADGGAEDGGNKDDSGSHWEASVAVWRSNCEAGIGVGTTIPLSTKICGLLLHVVRLAPAASRGKARLAS